MATRGSRRTTARTPVAKTTSPEPEADTGVQDEDVSTSDTNDEVKPEVDSVSAAADPFAEIVPIPTDPEHTGEIKREPDPGVVLSANDSAGEQVVENADVPEADVYYPSDEERAAVASRIRAGEITMAGGSPWPGFAEYDESADGPAPAVGDVVPAVDLLGEDTTSPDGRPACRISHGDSEPQLPEFIDNAGLCAHHWVVRPDMREVARRGH